MQKWILVGVTAVVALSVAAQVAANTTPATPELDGSALGAGVALLASGALMYRVRTGR